MKRMLRMSAAVLAGLGVLVAGTWILSRTIGTPERLYQGKTIYYWSLQMTNQDAAASNKAAAILYSKIIPDLTNEIILDTHDSKLRVALVEQLNALPGIQVYFQDAGVRRAQAVSDLASFGPGPRAPRRPCLRP